MDHADHRHNSWLRVIDPEKRWRPFIYFVALLLLCFFVFGLAYLALPHLRRVMVLEDGFIENFTVFFYLEALVVVGVLLMRRKASRDAIWVGGLSLFFLLEEISYGQRLFPNLSFPKLANGATFDAVSDLNRVMTITLERIGVPWELFVISAALLIALVAGRRIWGRVRSLWDPERVWPYVLVAALLLAFATWIDTYVNPPTKFVFLEELTEMGASLSMLFAALVAWRNAPHRRR